MVCCNQSKFEVSSQKKLKSRSRKSSKRVSATNNLSSRKNNRKQLGGNLKYLKTVIDKGVGFVQSLPDGISGIQSLEDLLKSGSVEIGINKMWRRRTSILSEAAKKYIFKIVTINNQIILLCGKKKDNDNFESLQYLVLLDKSMIKKKNSRVNSVSTKLINQKTGIDFTSPGGQFLEGQLEEALGV